VEHGDGDDDVVDNSIIQQISALPKQENADDVILVTTSSLTKDAASLAGDLGVLVVDFDQLCSTIDSADLYSTVAEFVEVNDSRDQQVQLETLAERITANTVVDSKEWVYEELFDIFSDHQSAPRVDKEATLNAFVESDSKHDWQHSTTVRWESKPKLDADKITNQLAKGLSERDLPEVEAIVLSSVIESELRENLGTPLEEASISELAEWYVDDFREGKVPLVAEGKSLAIEIAEDAINPNESVISNKLRVAGKLNLRYDERYETA
jgi:hypothetical protein